MAILDFLNSDKKQFRFFFDIDRLTFYFGLGIGSEA